MAKRNREIEVVIVNIEDPRVQAAARNLANRLAFANVKAYIEKYGLPAVEEMEEKGA